MPHFKVVLFDFDGTLYDTWPAIREAFCLTYRHFKLGDDISHIDIMPSIPHDYDTAFKLAFKTETPDKAMIEYAERLYLEIVADKTELFPQVRETIDELNSRGIIWGIVTTKRRHFTEAVLTLSSFKDFCKVLVCAEDVSNLKPDPEGLIKACNNLGVKQEEALYVGDSESDAKASQACGMKSAIVFYGNEEKARTAKSWGADYYLSSMPDLLPLFDRA